MDVPSFIHHPVQLIGDCLNYKIAIQWGSIGVPLRHRGSPLLSERTPTTNAADTAATGSSCEIRLAFLAGWLAGGRDYRLGVTRSLD